MIEKLEQILRKAANAARLEAEKKRAQRDRQSDAKAHKKLDDAMRVADERKIGPDHDVLSLLRRGTQLHAESRGFLTSGEDGKWRYNSGKVDRHERPAERLAEGEVKADRWRRVKDAKNEAQAAVHYCSQHYAEVVYDTYRQEANSVGGMGQRNYDEWRDEEIRQGLKEGFIELRPNGKIRLVEQGSPHNRPAEKLLTGKVKSKKRSHGRSM